MFNINAYNPQIYAFLSINVSMYVSALQADVICFSALVYSQMIYFDNYI